MLRLFPTKIKSNQKSNLFPNNKIQNNVFLLLRKQNWKYFSTDEGFVSNSSSGWVYCALILKCYIVESSASR